MCDSHTSLRHSLASLSFHSHRCSRQKCCYSKTTLTFATTSSPHGTLVYHVYVVVIRITYRSLKDWASNQECQTANPCKSQKKMGNWRIPPRVICSWGLNTSICLEYFYIELFCCNTWNINILTGYFWCIWIFLFTWELTFDIVFGAGYLNILIQLRTYIWYCFGSWDAPSSAPPPRSAMLEIWSHLPRFIFDIQFQIRMWWQQHRSWWWWCWWRCWQQWRLWIPGMMRKVRHHWHQSLKDLEGGSLKKSNICFYMHLILIYININ